MPEMKVKPIAVLFMLLLPGPCFGQNSGLDKRPSADAYRQHLVRLLNGLQKNPWAGWKSGTRVTIRYLSDGKPPGESVTYVQPDMVYEVLQADQLFARTQVVNGKPHRQEFQVRHQAPPEVGSLGVEDMTPAELEIDGFRLAGLYRESPSIRIHGVSDGPPLKEWRLASHPALVLRREFGGTWEVSSALARKKVGDREFECVETKEQSSIYVDRPIDVFTTRYLSPEVPGHLIEEVMEFYKAGERRKGRPPHLVIHQKVVEFSLR